MRPVRRELLIYCLLGIGFALGLGGSALVAAPSVTNTREAVEYSDLSAAIGAAQPSDTLMIEGRHIGNFIVDKPLTLKGTGGALLDGAGFGTTLVIQANDVTVEDLTLTGSGQVGSPNDDMLWGPAGLRIEGDRARLSGLEVVENAWGVLFLGGTDSALSDSVVSGNAIVGVKTVGGSGHRIENNEIPRNRVGLQVAARFGDAQNMVPFNPDDPEALKRRNEMWWSAEWGEDITVESNVLRGNDETGIRVDYRTRRIALLDNKIFLTGHLREEDWPPTDYGGDVDVFFWAGDRFVSMSEYAEGGTGIVLSCMTEDDRVIGNHVHDNLVMGMVMTVTNRALVEGNTVTGNLIGVQLVSGEDNTFRTNRIADNRDFGMVIAAWGSTSYPFPPGPSGNLVVRNSLTGNGLNAWDNSDFDPGLEERLLILGRMPVPPEMREKIENDPDYLREIAKQSMQLRISGANRWDDGTVGNHYGDFDEEAEGFRDTDKDGLSEVAHPIPGGGHVDHFPLSASRAATP